jgi:hypothetical protein
MVDFRSRKFLVPTQIRETATEMTARILGTAVIATLLPPEDSRGRDWQLSDHESLVVTGHPRRKESVQLGF